MNKDFHRLVPVISLQFMPESFKSFLICSSYNMEQLQIDSDIADLVDKDNITQDAEIHHAHSYKMDIGPDGQLRWLDGEVLDRLKGLCADAHDFHAEKKPDLVRYCLGKMTHYRIDALTAPHLHKGRPWSLHHKRYEDEMGNFSVKHQYQIGPMEFKVYKNVFDSCHQTAIEMWPIGLDIVAKYEKGTPLTDEERLNVLRICVQGVGDLWLTLANELKLGN